MGPAIPASFFTAQINNGTTTSIWADYAPVSYIQTPWPSIGYGTIRLWDANGCSWRNINTSPGVYNWSYFDQYCALINAHGLKVIYNLGCPPDWATAPNYGQTYYTQPGNPIGWHVGYNPWPPVNDSDWTTWCTAVVNRFAYNGITGVAYEIWNEFDDNSYGAGAVGTGYAGTLSRLVTLASLARTAVKAADSTATMLSPNITGNTGLTTPTSGNIVLQDYLAAGGMAYADAVSVHSYVTTAPWPRPEGQILYASQLFGLLSLYGISKPVWMTEWGYGLWQDSTGAFRSGPGGTPAPDPMPATLGASYMTRMMLLSWLSGFQTFSFYAFDAFNYDAILMANPSSPGTLYAPATAFRYVSGLLTGGKLAGLVATNDASGNPYWYAQYQLANGQSGKVYWCDDYSTASIPIPGAISGTDNQGNVLTLGPNLTITSTPQFIRFS